jgi:hypothetical protein
MNFQLHPEARQWFKKVRGIDNKGNEPLETWFDVYQLCFTLGIAKAKYEPLDASGDTFMEEFIQRYRPYRHLIIGAMLVKALKRQSISLTSRVEVVKEIERLVQSDESSIELTPAGFRELNAYANGGFNCLREELEDPPNDMAFLLSRYQRLMTLARGVPGM